MPSPSSSPLTVLSKCTLYPNQKSTLSDLKLSISDLAMLSCHYIQKGCLFPLPSLPFHSLLPHLKSSLSRTLSHFPPLAGRLTTDSHGYVYITCNDAGVDFLHACAPGYCIRDLLSPPDVPDPFKRFFTFDKKVSYTGHFSPLLAVQVTELADGVFIGCAMNHAIADGTSFWNFFNTFAEVCREATKISNVPDFRRDSILISKAVLKFPEGGPEVTFNPYEPLRERIFSFSREAIQKLKATVNSQKLRTDEELNAIEWIGKQSNDNYHNNKGKVEEISSFQSLCALLWRGVTRARKLHPSKTTVFKMAVNCRMRLAPKLNPYYFGNAIQSIPTYATAEDVLCRGLRWCAEELNKNVKAHDDAKVRHLVEEWESNPRCFPLGNPDGTAVTMGSSPRFPMYDNDFGWGRPVAVRSGGANKFDGKISAFPGREGGGSVDLEVLLAPETMEGLESDLEFMAYASSSWCN
ncbi:uncharacterized acetyltransferase At3g50280-like [Neltuma alba]|uniref:uncharacterized acetyltransferase At3g50280-like n=1 Tax=Neltuma alba TaxID=207710 RepID=UPI0010A3E4B2|nr:uncharacterized acetyltransferase At3g50280-like [Prosopis alba]